MSTSETRVTQRDYENAREVVAHPERHAHYPGIFEDAWDTIATFRRQNGEGRAIHAKRGSA